MPSKWKSQKRGRSTWFPTLMIILTINILLVLIVYVFNTDSPHDTILNTYIAFTSVKNTYVTIPTVKNTNLNTSSHSGLTIIEDIDWNTIDINDCYCNYNYSYNYSDDWRTNPNNRVYSDIPSLIWKFGIAMSCDFHDSYFFMLQNIGKEGESQKFQLTNTSDIILKISNLTNGSLIYFSTKQLNSFVSQILPTIIEYEIYFSLIIVTSVDYVIPLNYHQQKAYKESFSKVLNNKYLLYIFCENFDGSTWQWKNYNDPMSNKIYPIPDGFDFHSPMKHALQNSRSNPKWNDLLLPSQLEHRYKLILANMSSFSNSNSQSQSWKHFSVFLDYYLNYGVYVKKTCGNGNHNSNNSSKKPGKLSGKAKQNKKVANSLNENKILNLYKHKTHYKKSIRGYIYCQIVNYVDNYDKLFSIDDVQRAQIGGLIQRSKYVFSLSLFGNGLDCHRTYESILMDNIVIVLSSPLDILYKLHDMPIVIIDSVREINSTMLHYWYEKYKHKTYLNCQHTRDVLTTKYWVNYMKQMTSKKLDYLVAP